MTDNRAQIPPKKLAMLLSILAIIWVLCYNAQLQFPARHNMAMIDRLGKHGAGSNSILYATEMAKGSGNKNQKQYLGLKYGWSGRAGEQGICVVVEHDPRGGRELMARSMASVLRQKYSYYRVQYVAPKSLMPALQAVMKENSLSSDKLRIIAQDKQPNYLDSFAAMSNCSNNQIVIYMTDSHILLGDELLHYVNQWFQRGVQALYSGSLLEQQRTPGNLQKDAPGNETEYVLGNSWPYPESIVKNGRYHDYPFLVDGLFAFKRELVSMVTSEKVRNEKGKAYKEAGQVALGLAVLQAAKDKAKYIPEPLVLKTYSVDYIIRSPSLRAEQQQIRKKY